MNYSFAADYVGREQADHMKEIGGDATWMFEVINFLMILQYGGHSTNFGADTTTSVLAFVEFAY